MKPTPAALNGSSRSVNARLADVEPIVEALLSRCDDLLTAGKALAARVTCLEDRCQAMDADAVAALTVLSRVSAHVDQLQARADQSLWERFRDWAYLRTSWLVRGV